MITRSFSRSKNPNKVIIALHGWTGDVTSMEPIARTWNLEDVNWVLLQAPYHANDGGFSWFDGNEEIGWQYEDSFNNLLELIDDLNRKGFPNHVIFILGFSQGACLSMEFMIRQNFSLGGIIPIAGFIRYKDSFKKGSLSKNNNTPVLLLHGSQDEIIVLEESRISLKLFIDAGYKATLHILASRHKIPLQAKEIIEKFILD